MEKRATNVMINDATLIFLNFRGEGSQYNRDGDRNFGVLLCDELAETLHEDGWNVKHLRPRDDDPERYAQPWLPVKVKFGKIPPVIMLINSRGKKRLNEDTVEQLDWTRIKYCDVIIRPYEYPAIQGRPAGISAYVKALYVTIDEDELEQKYADIPDLDEADY